MEVAATIRCSARVLAVAAVPALAVILILGSGCGQGTRPGNPPDAPFDTVEFVGTGWGSAPGYHLAWAIQAGGAGLDDPGDYGDSVDFAPNGDLFVSGTMYSNHVTFGAGTDSEISYYAWEEGCPFLARYSGDGTPIWVATVGAQEYDVHEVVAREDGSAVVVGRVSSHKNHPPVFGAGEPGEIVLDVSCTECPFLAAYREDGTFGWVSHGDSEIDSDGRGAFFGLARATDGNWCTGGYFFKSLVLGDAASGTAIFSGEQGIRNGFVARYNADGGLLWAREIRATGTAWPQPVAALADGSCAFGVYFQQEVLVNTGGGKPILIQADGDWSYLVAVYDAGGNLVWAKDIGVVEGTGSGLDLFAGGAIGSVSALGDDLVVAGQFSGSLRAGTEAEPEVISAGSSEKDRGFYVARLRGTDGSRVWTSIILGKTNHDRTFDNLSAMAILPGNIVLVGGGFTGRKIFGAGEAHETELVSTGPNLDGFLATYNGNGSLLWAVRIVSNPFPPYPPPYEWGEWVADVAVSGTGSILATGQFLGTATFGTGADDSVDLESFGDFDVFVLRLDPDDVPATQ